MKTLCHYKFTQKKVTKNIQIHAFSILQESSILWHQEPINSLCDEWDFIDETDTCTSENLKKLQVRFKYSSTVNYLLSLITLCGCPQVVVSERLSKITLSLHV